MSQVIVFPYSEKEEKLNVISHAFGFLLALVGSFLLFRKALALESHLHFWAYFIYAASWVLLYAASTLYHNEKKKERRVRLNILDHSAIYLAIAGTYIPVMLIGIGGKWGWSIAISVGAIALIGVTFKLFFTGRFRLASTISYVLMGSLIFIAAKPLIESVSHQALLYILIGNLLFVIGAVFYSIRKIPFGHAIFHVFVLAASIFHFLAIYLYI